MSTDTFIEQTFEFWLEEFKPITNHLDENASFQDEDGNGIMFETYGDAGGAVQGRWTRRE